MTMLVAVCIHKESPITFKHFLRRTDKLKIQQHIRTHTQNLDLIEHHGNYKARIDAFHFIPLNLFPMSLCEENNYLPGTIHFFRNGVPRPMHQLMHTTLFITQSIKISSIKFYNSKIIQCVHVN
jgi:hypothetical protein